MLDTVDYVSVELEFRKLMHILLEYLRCIRTRNNNWYTKLKF